MIQQTFHIFKKDVRRFVREIILIATAALCFALFQNQAIGPIKTAFEVVFAILAMSMIASVIQEDRIPGDTQFWITRPFRWESMLAAKVLFILVFVNMPVFFAQAAIVAHFGFALRSNLSALLWLQVPLLIVVEFPVACVAAVTSNLKQFVWSLLGALFPVFLYILIVIRLSEAPDIFRGVPSSVDWIGWTLAASILVAAAMAIAYLQYRRRWSRASRTIASCAWVGAAMIALVGTSWELTAQELLSAQPAQVSDVRLDANVAHAEVGRDLAGIVVRIAPITIVGVPDGYEVHGDQAFARVEWPDGETHLSANGKVRGNSVDIPIFLSDDVFNRERDQPATIQLSVYLTMFGNPRTITVPMDAAPSQITDNVSCVIEGGSLFCLSAFRHGSKLLRTSIPGVAPKVWENISYSPFPAELQLDPIAFGIITSELTRPAVRTSAASGPNIVTEDAIAHFKRSATLQIRFAELPIAPSPK